MLKQISYTSFQYTDLTEPSVCLLYLVSGNIHESWLILVALNMRITLLFVFFLQGCRKTCYQKNVIALCGCGDPSYPLSGQSLGDAYPPCDINNEAEGNVLFIIYILHSVHL